MIGQELSIVCSFKQENFQLVSTVGGLCVEFDEGKFGRSLAISTAGFCDLSSSTQVPRTNG